MTLKEAIEKAEHGQSVYLGGAAFGNFGVVSDVDGYKSITLASPQIDIMDLEHCTFEFDLEQAFCG